MAYEIYWGSGSPYSWRALMALEHKGLEYQSRPLQMMDGEHKTPEYLAMNPRGTVPLLVDGDTTIYESLAILTYLEAAHPKLPLFGTTPVETGLIWQAISEQICYIDDPAIELTLVFFRGQSADQGDRIGTLAGEIHGELASIETRLTPDSWAVGDAFSAADILLYPTMACLLRAVGKEEAAPFELGFLPLDGRYPKLAAWMARVEALPWFDRTWPPHWRS